MDIRFVAHAASGQSIHKGLADHARLRLQFRLRHRSERLAYVSVRLGDTRSGRGRQEAYCVMQIQLRDAPAATVVDIGADAYDTIDRATDRVAQLVEELLSVAEGRRLPSARTQEVAA
jgi:hypothetical protein